MQGFYVLTKNRDLRFYRKTSKSLQDDVRRWEVTEELKPAALWRIAIEAHALGLSLQEALNFLARAGLDEASGREFAHDAGIGVEGKDGIVWLAVLIVSGGRSKPPVTKMGSGSTLLGALADLLRPGIFMSPRLLEGVAFEGVPAA